MKILNKVFLSVLFGLFVVASAGVHSVIAAGPSAVNLGSAGNFTILTKTGISTTGVTSVVGDIGVSPAPATYITGFSLSLPVGSAFSTSPLVTGKIYAPGYADPTPVNMTTAVSDMEIAYTNAQGRTNPTTTELGAGNISGMTLSPGLYKWGTGVTITSDVTLLGSANDVWIFQVAQNLNVSSGVRVLLSGGAQASNVFWAVAGQATIGTTAVFNGIILSQTAIVLNTGAVLNGRALAQTAVTLDANSVNAPTVVSVVSAPSPVVATVVPITAPTTSTPTATTAVQIVTTSHNVASPQSSSTSITNIAVDTGCYGNNKFSTLTGRNCVSVMATTNIATASDPGCVSGNKFSTVTGKNCGSQAGVAAFGQQNKSFSKNLWKGVIDSEVKMLQEFLISQNKGLAARNLGKVSQTRYFGELTRAAVAEYQAAVGISPASGNFGPQTRMYISSH